MFYVKISPESQGIITDDAIHLLTPKAPSSKCCFVFTYKLKNKLQKYFNKIFCVKSENSQQTIKIDQSVSLSREGHQHQE